MHSASMEYVTAQTPDTDHTVYLPSEHDDDDTRLEEAEALLEPALEQHDRALTMLRDRRVPSAIQCIEEAALQLAPYSPLLLKTAALMALQHHDHELAQRAIVLLERYGVDDADQFREELERRTYQWNEYFERPASLREKYAKENPDVSYRELLLLRDRFAGHLTSNECEHLHRWRITETKGALSDASEQQDVSRPVMTGLMGTAVGWLLRAVWRR